MIMFARTHGSVEYTRYYVSEDYEPTILQNSPIEPTSRGPQNRLTEIYDYT